MEAGHWMSLICHSITIITYLVGALSLVNNKDYIRAEHKLHSMSKLFVSQVIIHKACFFKKSIYIPRAINSGTCIWLGDLFYSAGLHKNHVLATANTEKNQKRSQKKCR